MDYEEVKKFHGHSCFGLVVGYKVAETAMKKLKVNRAVDEEIVALVENKSCAVDAIQLITGCTLGKGNLFLRDYGKHVYTFALRPSGKGIRISLKPGIFPSEEILKSRPDEVFEIKEVKVPLPEKAEIADSVECASCGEYVMSTKAIKVNERFLCIPCHQK